MCRKSEGSSMKCKCKIKSVLKGEELRDIKSLFKTIGIEDVVGMEKLQVPAPCHLGTAVVIGPFTEPHVIAQAADSLIRSQTPGAVESAIRAGIVHHDQFPVLEAL